MTKKSIKLNLSDALNVLNLDYHDFLVYYNENVYPVAKMETDYYTVFRSQRSIASAEVLLQKYCFCYN